MAQCRLLILEDESELLNLLDLVFEGAGCKTTTCSDGLVALECIQREPLDVLLLDVMVPGMDGLDVLKEVRRTVHPRPLIWLMSAHLILLPTGAKMLGAEGLIRKPFDSLDLLVRIVMDSWYRATGGKPDANNS